MKKPVLIISIGNFKMTDAQMGLIKKSFTHLEEDFNVVLYNNPVESTHITLIAEENIKVVKL